MITKQQLKTLVTLPMSACELCCMNEKGQIIDDPDAPCLDDELCHEANELYKEVKKIRKERLN